MTMTATMKHSQTILKLMPDDDEQPDERYSATLTKDEFLREFFAPTRKRVAVVELTAVQAQWLFETSPGNRNWVPSNLERLQKDMESNRMTLSGEVLFDRMNRLRNGHHRFFSQFVTQTKQQYTIRRRCREEELVNIDSGAKRNGDAQMGFIPDFREKYGETDNNEGRIIGLVVTRGGHEKRYLSPTEKADGILYFKDDLNFIFNIIEATGKRRIKGLTHAASMAVFLRALAGVKASEKESRKEKIKYALEYLSDGGLKVQNGQMTRMPGTDSLFALNRFYSNIEFTSNSTITRKIYQTTANMLQAYLKGEEKSNAVAAGSRSKKDIELFPMPVLPFLQKQGRHEALQTAMGRNIFAALVAWGRSAQDGKEYKPIEIATKLCGEKFLVVAGASSPKAVSTRLGRAIKNFDSIDFPGGCLIPANQTKRGVTLYLFQKVDVEDAM